MLKNVVVVGGGVLGSQIAYQAAYKGFNVTLWLRSEGSIERAKPKIEKLHQTYIQEINLMKTPQGKSPYVFCRGLADAKTFTDQIAEECLKNNDHAFSSIRYEVDMKKAVEDADIVIESMSEDPQAKIDVYQRLASLLPEKTILVTNSSTMIPSTFAKYTGRPEKYLALHFANSIWKNNTAEVMGHPGTSVEAYTKVVEFAAQIGMIPLQLHKEQPGYILNSMLVPFLISAMSLYVNEVSDAKTIDLTWSLGTGAPMGPFKILDIVGIKTAYDIVSHLPGAEKPDTVYGKIANMLHKMIEEGKTGIASGVGFYQYKNN